MFTRSFSSCGDASVPIYEYQCDACGKRSEVMQKIADAPLSECPQCGEKKLRKLVSAAAFRLKGGGWYETDFKDSKARKNVIGGDDAGAKGGEKSESKSEEKKSEPAKTEAKVESTPASKVAGE